MDDIVESLNKTALKIIGICCAICGVMQCIAVVYIPWNLFIYFFMSLLFMSVLIT